MIYEIGDLIQTSNCYHYAKIIKIIVGNPDWCIVKIYKFSCDKDCLVSHRCNLRDTLPCKRIIKKVTDQKTLDKIMVEEI